MEPHFDLPPSPWVQRWVGWVRPGGAVLDLACGSGRHSRLLAKLGFEVDAVDRAPELFERPPPRGEPARRGPRGRPVALRRATLRRHRGDQLPASPAAAAARRVLEHGGVLIYETFARGNERFGKPSNPAFLLAPGELLEAFREKLHIVAYEDLVVDDPRPAAVQRLCARRE
jgi:SAM-dependent methyltransferase